MDLIKHRRCLRLRELPLHAGMSASSRCGSMTPTPKPGPSTGHHVLFVAECDSQAKTGRKLVWLAIMLLPTSATAAGVDFQTRCAQPGVVRCVGFDSRSAIACTTWGCTSGVDLGGTTAAPVIDTTTTASGPGSLKFTITSQSGASGAGSYWTNFTNDLKTQFGAGDTFYVQWRQRFSPELLNTVFRRIGGGNAGGWKQLGFTTGDIATTPCPTIDDSSHEGWCQVQFNEHKVPVSAYASCTPIDILVQNTDQRKFAQMYNTCSPNSSHGAPYWSMEESLPDGDVVLQPGRPAPFCLYSQQAGGNFFPPNGNCSRYFPNEWMTFTVKLSIGRRGAFRVPGIAPNHVWLDRRSQMCAGREGQPTELIYDRQGFDLGAGNSGAQRLGKIYLLPYHSYKDPTQVHQTAYTWYDELIISRDPIADPGGPSPPPRDSGA